MRRNEFLKALGSSLRGLKDDERNRYIANYSELLDDKLEAGMSEEAAIAELGDPAKIAGAIIADARELGTLKSKRNPLSVCLIILGSPVWFALLAAAFAVLLALYAVVWALIVSACAVELSIMVVFPASVVFFAVNVTGNMPFSLFVLGLGLVCAAVAAACWKPLAKLIASLAGGSAKTVKNLLGKLKSKGRALI